MDRQEKTEKNARIAFFMPSLRGGGAERAMLLFAGAALKRGLTVDLLVARGLGPLLSEIPAGVRVIDFGAARVSYAIPALYKYLRREKPVALFSTIINANVMSILASMAAKTSTRIVVREANAPNQKSSEGIGNKLLYRLVPKLYSRADAIICVSQGVAEQLCKLNPALSKLITVLPTPVVSDEMLALAEQYPSHIWFEHPCDTPLILAAGRLSEQKDFPTLIRAFATIRKTRPLRLLILGEGPLREPLLRLSEELHLTDDISLPGFVANPFSYMRRAKVFVLSSRYEGMPNVLLQALACGAAVVSTDCECGPREILQEGSYGALVPVGDVDAMAAAILQSLEQGPHPHAAEYVKRRFHVDTAVDQYLKVGMGVPDGVEFEWS